MRGQQFLFDSENKNVGLYSMLEVFEKQYILRVLEQYNWHRGKASSYLGIPPRTLYRKIKKYQLANE
jgi:DNA-binding NtrC family response regulator